MTLALSEDFPLQDLIWTMLMVFGWALFLYLLFVVFRDLFGRDDVSAWGKAGWVLLVLVLPIIGALVYLASQSAEMGERELRRNGARLSGTASGAPCGATPTRRWALSSPARSLPPPRSAPITRARRS